MVNMEVRNAMKSHGVLQWQIADYLGISEATMCRKMRTELKSDFREKVLNAIKILSE